MNLVQQANFLEDVPKDQLVSMSQDPNAQFPAFLVLSEIQRRTTNEKNYQAMVNQPTTTVAEEVVSDFAQPTGLQGGAPQATPLPTNISAGLSGAPTAPMQMAASGGITGYANKGQTELNYSNLRTKLTEDEIKIVNQAVMRDRTQRMQSDLGDKTGKFLGGGANVSEQIFSVLSGGGGNIPIFKGSPEEKKFIEVANIILENKNKKASGGVTGYATGDMTALPAGSEPQSRFGSMMDSVSNFGGDVVDFIKNDPVQAAALGLMIVPGVGPVASGVVRGGLAGYRLLKGYNYSKKAKEIAAASGKFANPKTSPLFTSPSQTAGKNLLPQTLQSGRAVPVSEVNRLGSSASRRYSPGRTSLTGTGLLAGKTGYDYMTSPVSQTDKKDDTKDIKPMSIGSTFEEILAMNQPVDTDSKSKGLGQMDYRDMIRLGVGVMGAKDMSELGKSVVGVLDAQDKRGIQELQSRYMQVQTEKLEADIAAMPLKELVAAQNALSASIKAKLDAGITLTPEETIEANTLFKFYETEIAKRQGFAKSTLGSEALSDAEKEIFEQSKAV